MLYAIMLLGALCIVETVQRTDQITGDAADSIEGTFILGASAAGTLILDDAGEAADGIAVNGMVNGAVTDAALLHVTDNLFKGFEIVHGIAVHFNVGDVAGIGKGMVGSLDLDLLKCSNGIIDGNMETVGVIFAVGYTGDGTVNGLIHLYKTTGEAFGGSGQQGEV